MMFFKNKKLEEAEQKIAVLEGRIYLYEQALDECKRYITHLAYENYELKKKCEKVEKKGLDNFCKTGV
ncbi:MAG: hypothetical protein IJS26_03720 [Alphaproteobacteria bacterium]|nr:hypothetical protein [Alphaproteobacteria bacterium]